jgi:sugar/nucleoside kinase (ribokinase family)
MLFTVGEALAVFLVDQDLPMSEATRFRRTVAGAETNVAAGVIKLGLPARLVTTVGQDALGDAVVGTLSNWKIDTRVERSLKPTGVLIRTLAPGIPAVAVHLRDNSAATEIRVEQIDAAWSDEVSVVFVTGITAVRSASAKAAVERTVELARASGALVVADANLRLRLGDATAFTNALAGIRGKIDIAIGDLTELAILAGSPESAAVTTLLSLGCGIVITKLGADGAEATDGSHIFRTPTFATEIIDTVGAGDAFAAGFIAAHLREESLEECLRWGSVVAASVVATAGDIEGLPGLDDVLSSSRSSK